MVPGSQEGRGGECRDSFGGYPGLYPAEREQGTNRARIANPGSGPDQFHAKRGYFHARCSGKAFCGVILGIRAISKEILKTLTGINQWPNDAGIILGQVRESAGTLSGDPMVSIPRQKIRAQIRPGLPIREVVRINFMQKGGTFIHAVPGRHFAG